MQTVEYTANCIEFRIIQRNQRCTHATPLLVTRMTRHHGLDRRRYGVVQQLLNYPVTPAVKAMVARHTGDKEWRRVRAPLISLNDAEFDAIGSVFDRLHMAKAA